MSPTPTHGDNARKRRCSACRQYRFLRAFQGAHRSTVCLTCRRFAADEQQLRKRVATLKRQVKHARRAQAEWIDKEDRARKRLQQAVDALEWNRQLHARQKAPSVTTPAPLQQAA